MKGIKHINVVNFEKELVESTLPDVDEFPSTFEDLRMILMHEFIHLKSQLEAEYEGEIIRLDDNLLDKKWAAFGRMKDIAFIFDVYLHINKPGWMPQWCDDMKKAAWNGGVLSSAFERIDSIVNVLSRYAGPSGDLYVEPSTVFSRDEIPECGMSLKSKIVGEGLASRIDSRIIGTDTRRR
jgi:hypothetical protein